MPDRDDRSRIVSELFRSRKYGAIHRFTIERVVRDCLARYGAREAGKNARRVLHQVWGAFFERRPDFAGLAFKAEKALRSGKEAGSVLRPIMALQSSTRERVPILGEFLREILEAAGNPRRVADYACGLNPLAAILGMMPGVESYVGYDIDVEMVSFLEVVSRAAGAADRVRVCARDVLEEDGEETDCVLMLKLLPCLDLQKKGGALEAMRMRRCRRLVVSFPAGSISGRKRGMGKFYEGRFEEMAQGLGWSFVKLKYSSELVFVVCKKAE